MRLSVLTSLAPNKKKKVLSIRECLQTPFLSFLELFPVLGGLRDGTAVVDAHPGVGPEPSTPPGTRDEGLGGS